MIEMSEGSIDKFYILPVDRLKFRSSLYQEAFRTPGISPLQANSLKQIRQIPKSLR